MGLVIALIGAMVGFVVLGVSLNRRRGYEGPNAAEVVVCGLSYVLVIGGMSALIVMG